MAKAKIPNQRAEYNRLNKRLNVYVANVQSVFELISLEAARAVVNTDYDGTVPFRFNASKSLKKRAASIKSMYVSEIGGIIQRGIDAEWAEGNLAIDNVVKGVLKHYYAQVDGERYKHYYQENSPAKKAFIARKDRGMGISDKLWTQAEYLREELEHAISTAIEKGTSAVTLSKRISKYLLDFEKLKKDYKERFGTAVECYDCEYRSIRLARSEINMAYRTAAQERWQQLDFVVGYEIKLSGSHPHEDICDTLAGKYPKEFKWTGWHPNDLCYTVPILKTEDEFWEGDEMLAKGKEPLYESVNKVDKVPDAFDAWVVANRDDIFKKAERGTLPYFLKDNPKEYLKFGSVEQVSQWRHTHRNEEEIQQRWDNRQWLVENDYYRQIMSDRNMARFLGADINDLEDFIAREKLGDKVTAEMLDDFLESVEDRLQDEFNRYSSLVRQLKAIDKELQTPFGHTHMKALKAKVERYIANIPNRREYGAKANIDKLEEIVSLARRSIDAKVNKLYNTNLTKAANKLGVNVGEPMPFIKADNGLPNINYNVGEEYKVNCQCCVVSYELRRRGLNVTAMPRYKNGGVPDTVARNTTSVWVDINGMQPAKVVHKNTKNTAKDIKALVESKIREDGRYHLDWSWKGQNTGHIIVVEKKGNSYYWYDPQTDEKYFNINDLENIAEWFNLLRVDNLRVNLNKIGKVVRKL